MIDKLRLPVMCVASVLFAIGCDFGASSDRKDRVTGPAEVSVTPDMLIGATYRGRTGGDEYDDIEWTFDETHFRLVSGQAGLPQDLTDALLPVGVSGHRIDGRWSVHGEVLTVSELAIDGEPLQRPPQTLRTICTPVVRIQAAKHQYMFARGTAETAWRQGPIPEWPPGTTSVRNMVQFDLEAEGWLTVGYQGYTSDGEVLTGNATLRITPGRSEGYAVSPNDSPRHARLQLTGSGHATARYMAVPPGNYLFYAIWKPPDPRVAAGKIVVEFRRFRLEETFTTQWLSMAERPVAVVDLRLSPPPRGTIKVRTPESGSHQSVFLLPWGATTWDAPQLDDGQAWSLAWRLGAAISIEDNEGEFIALAAGCYRLFLAEHDRPADDDDSQSAYRLIADSTVVLDNDQVTAVSY